MTYNMDEVIAKAASLVIDPDRLRYPNLFKEYKFTQAEIDQHQAAVANKQVTPATEHPYQYLGNLARTVPKVIRLEEARFIPISGHFKVVPRSELKQAGWTGSKRAERSTVTYLEPDAWLDTVTGDLVTKQSARIEKIRIPMARSISARMLDTILRIKQCAPSEREFVTYVIKMRNRRGGLVVDLNSVIELWINHTRPNTDSTDKSRVRKRLAAILEKRRIMVNSQTLASDLQVLGNPTKQEIIEESARVFEVLKPKARAVTNHDEYAPFKQAAALIEAA